MHMHIDVLVEVERGALELQIKENSIKVPLQQHKGSNSLDHLEHQGNVHGVLLSVSLKYHRLNKLEQKYKYMEPNKIKLTCL